MDGGKFGSMINENLHELYQVKSKRGNKLNIPPLGVARAEERQGRFYHDGCQLVKLFVIQIAGGDQARGG